VTVKGDRGEDGLPGRPGVDGLPGPAGPQVCSTLVIQQTSISLHD